VAPEPPVVPTPIDPAATGRVLGSIAGAQGRPIEGALAFVAAGLEGYVFAPPGEPAAIENAGRGVAPRIAVARVGQRLLARSADGHLHTLVGKKGGGTLFNVPLLSSGQPTELRLRDAHGLVVLGCNAHPDEEESRLVVLAHPFFDFTDREGRFHLRGVPAGPIRVAAVLPGGGLAEAALDLAPGAAAELRLAAPR
jgi:hypothetical protein